MTPPDGFVEVVREGARVWARPEARRWAERALDTHGTLHRAARRTPGAVTREGRGTVYAVPAAPDEVEEALGRVGGRWAVRHYRRGGLVARVLGDRYLRIGAPRPFREAEVSEAVRALGIPTPRVVAAAVYPAGIFYRGDLVTRWIPDALELAQVLFDPERRGVGGSVDRRDALAEAGGLIRRMARAGVRHPDLNAKNVLLEWSGSVPDAYLLDLDRCTVSEGPAPGAADAMRERLLRSLRKFEKRADLEVPPGELRALERGVTG